MWKLYFCDINYPLRLEAPNEKSVEIVVFVMTNNEPFTRAAAAILLWTETVYCITSGFDWEERFVSSSLLASTLADRRANNNKTTQWRCFKKKSLDKYEEEKNLLSESRRNFSLFHWKRFWGEKISFVSSITDSSLVVTWYENTTGNKSRFCSSFRCNLPRWAIVVKKSNKFRQRALF